MEIRQGHQRHLGHEKHLCKMVVGDQATVEDIYDLVSHPQFICRSCKRLANEIENLCYPVTFEEESKGK